MKNKNIIIILLIALVFISCKGQTSDVEIIDIKEIAGDYKRENTFKFSEELLANKKEELSSFKLFAAGDIMFHEPQIPAAKTEDGYDFKDSFRYLNFILKDGYAVANFESTIADKNFSGYPMFRTPIEAMDGIKSGGFDLLALANNHSLDGKKEGVFRTREAAISRGFSVTGTHASEDTRPTIVEIAGRPIAFLNYTYGVNGLEAFLGEDQHLVNRIEEEKILEDIAYAKEHAKGIIAVVHWGTEYRLEPDKYQEYWADFMAKNGVDIILGSHPHVIEPAKWLDRGEDQKEDKVYCIYSMGNFLSNQRREYMNGSAHGEDGVIVELEVVPVGDRITAKKVVYHPTWVDRSKNPTKFTIIPVEMGLSGIIPELDEFVISRLKESSARTRAILGGDAINPAFEEEYR